MSKPTTSLTSTATKRLHCLACGNDYRFEELISFAVNYVTSEGHVVRQMDSEISGYRCAKCGEKVIAPQDWMITPEN